MPFVAGLKAPLPHNPFRQAPLLLPALAVAGGVAVGWVCREICGSTCWLGAMGVGAVLTLLLFFLSGRRKIRRWLLVPAFFTLVCVGSFLLSLSYERTETVWPEEERMWLMEVESIYKVQTDGVSVDVRLTDGNGKYGGKAVRLRMVGAKPGNVSVGDGLAFYGKIGQAWRAGNPGDFDYRNYLLTHGISGTAYAADSTWQKFRSAPENRLRPWLFRLRQNLIEKYTRYFDGEELAVLSALTLGDKTLLSASTRELFSETGTSHILALSGLHLGILFSLLQFVLFRWVRRRGTFAVANMLALSALWLFVLLAGAPLSLQRAAWMFSLLQINVCLQRTRAASLNNLAFAALALLLASPTSLFDAGFQMSFSAVAGIHLLNIYLWKRIPLPNWDGDRIYVSGTMPRKRRVQLWIEERSLLFLRSVVWPFVTVSVSAQLGTLPFVVYYFHNVAPYFLVANLLVIPAAYCLLTGALLFFLLPLPFVREAVAFCMEKLLFAMTHGLKVIGTWPFASLKIYPSLATILMAVGWAVCLLVFFNARRARLRLNTIFLGTLLVGGIIATEAFRLYPSRLVPQVIVYNLPRTTAVHFLGSARRSWLYSSVPPDSVWLRLSFVEKNFFAPQHIRRPQLLARQDETAGEMVRRGNLFLFRHTRLYILKERLPRTPAAAPFPVDVLVVGRGCGDSLSVVSLFLRPRRIVLDPTLSFRLRERWRADCRAAGLPCHDVREAGAFVLQVE